MGIKRIIDTEFWTDEKVLTTFNLEDKLFFLYLMTNPHTTQLGIYKILPMQIAFEIGCSVEAVEVLLDRFENSYGIIKYSNDTKEVAIKNYLLYSIVKGGKPVYDLLLKESERVKDLSLLDYIAESAYKSKNYTVVSFLNRIFNKEKENDKEKENEKEKEKENDNDNEESYHESYHESEIGENSQSYPHYPQNPQNPHEKTIKVY